MKVQIGTEYCAMEIAEYAVSRRYRHDTPISNLQLQKILYFLQVIHASETGELLFADQFEAWPYGPVIRDVYVKFSDCGGFPIKREFDTEINDSIRPFLDAGGGHARREIPMGARQDLTRRGVSVGRHLQPEAPTQGNHPK